MNQQSALSVPTGQVDGATRYAWIDSAKGIGILLVVMGHACGGLIDAHLPMRGTPVRSAFMAIYIFHMPLFFLLSGLLVEKRVRKGGGAFLGSIGTRIVYPYFLWSVVQFACITAAGSLVNTPASGFWRQIAWIPFSPVSQFWFLYALALMHLGSLLILPRFGSAGLLLAALIVRSLADLGLLSDIWAETAALFPYYALGVMLAPAGVEKLVLGKRGAVVAVACLGAFELLAITMVTTFDRIGLHHPNSDPAFFAAADLAHYAWQLSSLGAALAMTAATIALADRARGCLQDLLCYLGRMSMPIFILHILFIAGLRIVLAKLLHIDSIVVILPVIVAIGLVGPLIATAMLDRLRLAKPLGLS